MARLHHASIAVPVTGAQAFWDDQVERLSDRVFNWPAAKMRVVAAFQNTIAPAGSAITTASAKSRTKLCENRVVDGAGRIVEQMSEARRLATLVARVRRIAGHVVTSGRGRGSSHRARRWRPRRVDALPSRRILSERERGLDERGVGERLRIVPRLSPVDRVHLLAVQAERAAEREELVEERLGFVRGGRCSASAWTSQNEQGRNAPSPPSRPSVPGG